MVDSVRPLYGPMTGGTRVIISGHFISLPTIIAVYIGQHKLHPHNNRLRLSRKRPLNNTIIIPDCLHDNGTGPDLSCSSFYFQFHILIFCLFRVVDYPSAFCCILNTHYRIVPFGHYIHVVGIQVFGLFLHLSKYFPAQTFMYP